MAARNPLFSKGWSLTKWMRALVINDIWPELLFFTAVATMVSLVSKKTDTSLAISSQMLTVLGIVLGLVVSFRTSSAYDRYWEGRKLWTSINVTSRNIAHMIWVHIPNERPAPGTKIASSGAARETELRAVIEKKTMINLVQAFSVAIKHMLRGEPGIYYRDLYPLVCFLPRYAGQDIGNADVEFPLWDAGLQGKALAEKAKNSLVGDDSDSDKLGDAEKGDTFDSPRRRKTGGFDPEQVLPQIRPEGGVRLAEARNPPEPTVYDLLPFLLVFKPFVAIVKYPIKKLRGSSSIADGARDSFGRKKRKAIVHSNVPFEIALFLSTYFAWVQKQGLVASSIASGLTTNINALHDLIANMNRIRNTPIPFAYQAHLRMSMWMYLFFLPFQVYAAFGYLTIPATAFASFLLLGFLEIGQEIEDPFGYDLNDLDMDYFCLNIERELHEITAHPVPDPDTFIFGPTNQPFAPADRRSAKQLVEARDVEYLHEHTGKASVQKMLLKSWKEVLDKTVEKH